MTEEEIAVKQLKNDAVIALKSAERLMHKYAAACEVGPERIKAFEVFDNIRTAVVTSMRIPSEQL